MILDAGGGTVDLTTYRILGSVPALEIGELSSRSSSDCGSVEMDWLFVDLIKRLLSEHPGYLDEGSLAGFLHEFQHARTAFGGIGDDDTTFQFTCLNPSSGDDDPDIGLMNGELCIPGERLRREVFEPVVDKILRLIEDQLKALDNPVDGLVLVGGFGGNEYLFTRIQSHLPQIPLITRPPPLDTHTHTQSQSQTDPHSEEGPEAATLRGTVRFALTTGKSVGAMMIAPRSYVMKVCLFSFLFLAWRRGLFMCGVRSGVLRVADRKSVV